MILEIPEQYLKVKICSSLIAYELIKPVFAKFDRFDQDKEHFFALGLRRNNTPIYLELVSTGSLTATVVGSREVYRRAIAKAASSLIVFHNHPSGSCNPSKQDSLLTTSLRDSGRLIGIEITDHIIFAAESYYSYSDEGIIVDQNR